MSQIAVSSTKDAYLTQTLSNLNIHGFYGAQDYPSDGHDRLRSRGYHAADVWSLSQEFSPFWLSFPKVAAAFANQQEAAYRISETKEGYLTALEDTVMAKAERGPLIVLHDTLKAVKTMKEMCTINEVPFFPVTKDKEMADGCTVYNPWQRLGDVETLAQYGRGVDIRFKQDSVVVIGLNPGRMD